jgi:hypothetical protein
MMSEEKEGGALLDNFCANAEGGGGFPCCPNFNLGEINQPFKSAYSYPFGQPFPR